MHGDLDVTGVSNRSRDLSPHPKEMQGFPFVSFVSLVSFVQFLPFIQIPESHGGLSRK
jgi:hypothetical protein